MRQIERAQRAQFQELQRLIDRDPAFRARFASDPRGAVSGQGISTAGMRFPQHEEVSGYMFGTGRTCICICMGPNGQCWAEYCW